MHSKILLIVSGNRFIRKGWVHLCTRPADVDRNVIHKTGYVKKLSTNAGFLKNSNMGGFTAATAGFRMNCG